jgi:GH24 family phage-related lysozyme (muramidase)
MAKRALPAANRVSSVASGAARAATRLGSAAFNKMFPTLGRIINKVSGSKTDREEYDSKRTRTSLDASFSKNNDTFNAIIDAQSRQNQLLEQILSGLKRSSNPQSASLLPGLGALGGALVGGDDGPNIPDLPGLDRPERQQKPTPPAENRQRPNRRTRSRWSKFMRFLRRRAPALFARVGTKLATSAVLAATPIVGWLALAVTIGFAVSDVYALIQLWQEFNSLPESEQDDDEDDDQTPASPPPSPEEIATAERQQEAARENLGDVSQMGDTQNVTQAEQPVIQQQEAQSERRREQAGLTENLEDPVRQEIMQNLARARELASRPGRNGVAARNSIPRIEAELERHNARNPISQEDASRIQQPSAPVTVNQPATPTAPHIPAAPPAPVATPQAAAPVATPSAPSTSPTLAAPVAAPTPSTPSSAPALSSPAATPSTPAATAAPGLPEPSATPATKEPVAVPAPAAPVAVPAPAAPPNKPPAPAAPVTPELPAAKPAVEPPPAPETIPQPAATPVVTQPLTPAAEPAVKAPSVATPVVTPPVTPLAPSGPGEAPREVKNDSEDSSPDSEEDVPLMELEVSADRETGSQTSRWNVLEKNTGKPSKKDELPESFNAIRLEGNTLIYDFDKIRYEAGLIKFEGEGATSKPAASPVNRPSPAAAPPPPPPASASRASTAGSSGTDATPISAGSAAATSGGGNATGTDTAPISAGSASAPTGGGNATGTDTAPISAGPAASPTGGGNATRVNAPSVASTGGATPSFSGGDQQAMEMIKRHEGKRNTPYKDSLGLWTVGYGHLIGDGRSLPAEWNRTFSDQEIDALFAQDFAKHKAGAERIPGFDKANDSGKAAIIDLTFNMGNAWYRRFPNASAALARGDFETFANEMQNSLWFRQVGRRGPTIVAMLRAGGSGGSQTAATQTPSTPSSGGSVAQASTERVTAGREQTMNSQRITSNFNQQSTQREQPSNSSPAPVSQNVGEIPLRVRMLSTFNQLAQAS